MIGVGFGVMGARPVLQITEWRIIDHFAIRVLIPTFNSRVTPGQILAESLDFFIILVGHFLRNFKEFPSLLQHKKQALHNVVNLAFSVIYNTAAMDDVSVRAIKTEQIWKVRN